MDVLIYKGQGPTGPWRGSGSLICFDKPDTKECIVFVFFKPCKDVQSLSGFQPFDEKSFLKYVQPYNRKAKNLNTDGQEGRLSIFVLSLK